MGGGSRYVPLPQAVGNSTYGEPQALAVFSRSDHADWSRHWSTRSNELFVSRGRDVVAFRYTTDDGGFTVQREHEVAHLGDGDVFYGVTPDGQRFLIARRTTPSDKEVALRVVVNGLGSLKEPDTR